MVLRPIRPGPGFEPHDCKTAFGRLWPSVSSGVYWWRHIHAVDPGSRCRVQQRKTEYRSGYVALAQLAGGHHEGCLALGIKEVVWLNDSVHRLSFRAGTVIDLFSQRGRNIPDGSVQALMVVPGNPFQRCQLRGHLGFPRRSAMGSLGHAQSVDGLSQRIIVAVASAADRWFDASLVQTFGIADGRLL